MKYFIHLAVFLLTGGWANAQNILVSGTVTDAGSKEPLAGVSISAADKKTGTVSGPDGAFSLGVMPQCTLQFAYTGYKVVKLVVSAANPILNIKLTETVSELKEVNIQASQAATAVGGTQSSMIRLTPRQYAFVPAVGGEKDLVRVLQLMPGIKSGADGAPGMYVRGGTAGQNLVMLDGMPLYNASHAIGFFSVFNTDAVEEVKMYKGAFPANYGGRTSSVMDVKMREGNMTRWHTEGGVGILSARVMAEGPLLKNKLALMLAVRRTFIEQVFAVAGNKLPYYFYDINGKLTYKVNDKSRLVLSHYSGRDILNIMQENKPGQPSRINVDFGSASGNTVSSLKWNYTDKQYIGSLGLMRTAYMSTLDANLQGNLFSLQSKVSDVAIKGDLTRLLGTGSYFKAGADYVVHSFIPNKSKVYGSFNESIRSNEGRKTNTSEFSLYALHEYKPFKKLTVNYGMRLSGSAGNGFLYIRPEPRINASYEYNAANAFKCSYNKMVQHMHLISGSTAVMPTDLWYPVSAQIGPQQAQQVSAAWQHKLAGAGSVLSVELYSKWMDHLVEYREGTVVLLNDKIENDLITGKGKAYGMECMLQKTEGRLTGWVAYTLSWSTRTFGEINNGRTFYARYDRRHDFSVTGNYEFNKRVSLSASFLFASGSRVTPVIGQFLSPGGSYSEIMILSLYGSRNSLVLSPSNRLDVNLVIHTGLNRKWKGEWHIGAYNVYNRAQVYRVHIDSGNNGKIVYNQLGLFGFLPSVAYNFKF